MRFATKKNAALLKLLGATVVFLSVVSQHFQYDRAKADDLKLTQAIDDRSLIEKGALINQTSMYVLYGDLAIPAEDRSSLAAQHAAQVATKFYQALVPFVLEVEGIDKETKASDLETVRRAVGRVSDYRTLSDFMTIENEVTQKYEPAFKRQLDTLRERRSLSDRMYTGLYVLGGFLLFLPGLIDWRVAEETKVPARRPR